MAVAQEAPQMYAVTTIEVKPGGDPQLEEVIKKFKEAADKTNSPLRYTTAQSVSGNPVYTFNRPFRSFAAFGEQGPNLAETLGAAEMSRLMGLLQQSAGNESTSIYVARPDLSRPGPAQQATPEAVLYMDITVRAGKQEAFEGYVKKVVEAVAAVSPTQYWQMRQRTFGPGQNPVYRVVVTFPKWTALDTPPMPLPAQLAKHFGAAEAEKLAAIAADSIQGVNERLNRTRPDLSRPPMN
jgi:hypothetical protein